MKELIRRNEYVVEKPGTLVDFLLTSCSFLYSASDVLNLCAQNLLLKNGDIITTNEKVLPKDEIVLLTPQSLEPAVNEDIKLLYEDEYFFAISKPPQLPVHPTGKYYFNTLSSLVTRKLGLESLYPYNRLDRETSGIVLFAKKPQYVILLQEALIDKWYYALVFGILDEPITIQKPLLQVTQGKLRHHMVVDKKGREATTQVTPLAHNEKYTLVDVELITGRKHQIRVHLASLGNPLVGDKQYGDFPELIIKYASRYELLERSEIIEKVAAPRHLLHCHKVQFLHPKKNKLIVIVDSIEKNFLEFLNKEKIALF